MGTLSTAWSGQVLGELPIPVRSKWRGGRWLDVAGGKAQFAVPNEWHKKACDGGRMDVERVLGAHFGRPVPVEVVVEGGAPSAPVLGAAAVAPAASNGPTAPNEPDDVLSPDEIRQLEDADDVTVGGVDLLLREFGGELVEEDP